jgi:competence protein ComEA
MKIIFFVVLITVGYIYGMIHLERMRAEGLSQIGSNIYYPQPSTSSSQITLEKITITIEGAIRKPGTYSISLGASLQELISQAGGLFESADLKAIDLSYCFESDQKFYVASNGENKVSINYGDLTALDTLPGIGVVLANRIIDYRNANGAFRCLEQLMNVNGIGPTLFEGVRDSISLAP